MFQREYSDRRLMYCLFRQRCGGFVGRRFGVCHAHRRPFSEQRHRDRGTVVQAPTVQRDKLANLVATFDPFDFSDSCSSIPLSSTHTPSIKSVRVGTTLPLPPPAEFTVALSLSHPAFSTIRTLRNPSTRPRTIDQPWSKTSATPTPIHPKHGADLASSRYIGLALAVASTLAIGNAPKPDDCETAY